MTDPDHDPSAEHEPEDPTDIFVPDDTDPGAGAAGDDELASIVVDDEELDLDADGDADLDEFDVLDPGDGAADDDELAFDDLTDVDLTETDTDTDLADDDADAIELDDPDDGDGIPERVEDTAAQVAADWPDAHLGVVDQRVVFELADASGVGPDELLAAARAIGLDDLDDLDGRQTVRLLDEVGVEATVAHGGVDDLVEVLAGGGSIRFGGPRGMYELTAIDDRADSAQITDVTDGSIHDVPLDAVEEAWAASAYELIVATADPVEGGDRWSLVVLPFDLPARSDGDDDHR